MHGVRNRNGGTSSWQRVFGSSQGPSMSEMLAAAIGESVPDDLRAALGELDQGRGWNQSKEAEEWVVNACLSAESSDLLVEKINHHRVERLTGIRHGAGAVAELLPQCLSLAHIEFLGTAIHDDEADALVSALRGCSAVVTLAFRRCVMSDAALSGLVDELPQMHQLQTLRIEARSGEWLDRLGSVIAEHKTLTSLVLQIPKLGADKAWKLGESLGGSRVLTSLELDVKRPGALTSLLKGLASTERSSAQSCLAHLDLRSEAPLDDAFCDALSECIGTCKALKSIRIRPGVQALQDPIARLRAAIDNSGVEIDVDTDKMPEALAGPARFRPYQQLILSADALPAVANSRLESLPGWRTLSVEVQAKIWADLFGNGSPRDLWPLLGLMGLDRKALRQRSDDHCRRFTVPMGRRDLPYEPDLNAFMQFWRLQLSGIELGESAAQLLPEWQPTSKNSSGLSRDQRVFRRKLKEVGAELVEKQLKWVGRLIEGGNSDAAAFALTAVQRLIRADNPDLQNEAASLSRRLLLGEVRHHRRLAAAHLARRLFLGTLALAVASYYVDVLMRQLFDPDRAYGIGAPMTFDESFAQRRLITSWMVWPLVAVFAILLLKVEWVDAITRRLRLPQV